MWVGVWRLGLLWFVGRYGSERWGMQCQSEGNDTLCTCFQHHSVQECTKSNKNVGNEQPLLVEENNWVALKKDKSGDF